MEIYEVAISLLFMSSIVLAGVVIYLLRKDEKKKEELELRKREAARKFYEAKVLQEISEKIGYSLTAESVTKTIVNSFKNLFGVSSITSVLVENHLITQTTILKEAVGQKYIDKVQNLALNSLHAIDETTKGYKVNSDTQKSDDVKSYIALHFDPIPESYFSVPIVINNSCIGVVTIASRLRDAFTKEDIEMVFKVVQQAQSATERLESLIQAENSRMINLVSSLPTPAILFVKDDGKIKISAANPIATQILKLPANPTVDDIVWSVEGNINLHKLVEEVYGGGKSVFIKEVVLKNRYYKVYMNPVYTVKQDSVVGVTLSMLDVTLEIESEKLREKFTNMVVHELRAPMTSIKGGAGLLLKGNLEKEDQEKMLHIIADSSDRMLTQINDLLDAAKLEAGKFAIAPARADINELVRTKVDGFSYLASTKDIKLTCEIDESIGEMNFDKMRIDQVITNLLSNSLKFTQANGQIAIKTQKKDNEIIVSVKDNGMGVPSSKQNMLFVPFSQMQSAFRRDGTGLGLYISRGIVESHGGKIWMDSVEGKGTTVSFSIPLNIKADEEISPISQVSNKPLIPPVQPVN